MLFKSAPRFWEKSSFVKEPIRALIDRLISTALLPLAWLFGLLIWLKQILIDTGITQALGMHVPRRYPSLLWEIFGWGVQAKPLLSSLLQMPYSKRDTSQGLLAVAINRMDKVT